MKRNFFSPASSCDKIKSKENRTNTSHSISTASPFTSISCPICNRNISSDPILSNLHIDFCISKSETVPPPPQDESLLLTSKKPKIEHPFPSTNLSSPTERILPLHDVLNGDSSSSEKLKDPPISPKLEEKSVEIIAGPPEPFITEEPLEESSILQSPIKGHYLIKNFITEEEERAIIEYVDSDTSNPFVFSSFNGFCNSKIYGMRMKFGSRLNNPLYYGNSSKPDQSGMKVNEVRQVVKPDPALGERELPQFMKNLTGRVKRLLKKHNICVRDIDHFVPNECNVNEYLQQSKHYLRPHYDDRYLSGPLLLNLSLLGSCYMAYFSQKYFEQSSSVDAIKTNSSLNIISKITTREPVSEDVSFVQTQNEHVFKTFLSPRSLQIVSQDSRWYYQHAILKEDILTPRRLSLTIRMAGGKSGVQSSLNNMNTLTNMFKKIEEKDSKS